MSVSERVCCERWADGCPFPACDKGVKNHRKASIIPSENGPCGWLHGLRSHSLRFTTALPRASKFHSLFSALTPFLPHPLLLLHSLSCSPTLRKEPPQCRCKAGVDSSAPLRTVHMWTTFTGCLSTSPLINDIS